MSKSKDDEEGLIVMNFGGKAPDPPIEDPELKKIADAFSSTKAPVGSIKPRTVITFPSLVQAYQSDPAQAIANQLPLHEDPNELLNQLDPDELYAMTQRQAVQEKTRDIMEQNPYYQFAKLLKGLVGPQMGDQVANMSTDSNTGVVQIVVSDEQVTRDPAAPHVVGEVHEGHRHEHSAMDRARALKKTETAMNSSAVSGKTVFTELTEAKIAEALADLVNVDYEKFGNATLEDFLKDPGAIRMMARLTAEKFKQGMIETSPRYHKMADLVRIQKQVESRKKDMQLQLKYDSSLGGFKQCTPSEYRLEEARVMNKRRMAIRSVLRGGNPY